MYYVGFDPAKPGSEKSVLVIPDDAEICERNGEIVVTLDGKEHIYPKGTFVFSQSGLKNACDPTSWIL